MFSVNRTLNQIECHITKRIYNSLKLKDKKINVFFYLALQISVLNLYGFQDMQSVFKPVSIIVIQLMKWAYRDLGNNKKKMEMSSRIPRLSKPLN